MSVEHDRDEWGEAFFQDEHSAWVGGSSMQLHAALNESPPAVLLLAGVTRVEHMCKPAALGPLWGEINLVGTRRQEDWRTSEHEEAGGLAD